MKRILTILAVAFSLVLAASTKNTASAQVGVGVQITYQDFYDELSPHGRWMEYPEYGYVWMPNAGADFRPYSTNGRWVWSDDYEWIWVSDYSWGWAPFHYGRWFQDPMYGWMWMPGYEWAPAWVAWRDGGDYYGWAPIRPGINIGINFSIGSYNPPVDYWCFTPRRYISSPRIYNYCLPARQNVTIINNTTIINNYNRRTNNVFVTGPRRGDAERYAGRINPVRFREVNSPGRSRVRNNEVSFYRPSIRQDNNNRAIAPRNFDRYNNRNGQNNGNGRDNAAAGGRQINPRNGDNDRNRDNNRDVRANANPGRDDNAGTSWRRDNPRSNDNNRDERVNTSPERNNNDNGWRQNNPRTGDDNNRIRERRDATDRQPVNRQPDARPAERPATPRTTPMERTDRMRPQMDNNRQPERRPAFERRPDNNNEMQRRSMNTDNRPSRQPSPQMNREQRPMRQMESRPSMNRGGGEQRGGGRRRD